MADDDTPSLLRLPPEVHNLILNELPLSSHLLYKTQMAQKEVRELIARQEHNQRKIPEERRSCIQSTAKGSIWDTSSTATPRPAPAKSASSSITPPASAGYKSHLHRRHPEELDAKLVHHDHPEVDLFLRCMRMLGKMDYSCIFNQDASLVGPVPPIKSDRITVLSLLSRTGFKVASLIQLLETQPNLYHVETIFMTSASFIDAVLWTVFIPPQAKRTRTHISTRASTHFDLEFSQSTCIDTAAIVIPGPFAEKGRGLRSGFKCLCFSNYTTKILETKDDIKMHPFHVIFHDYYTEEEAIGTQDMLKNSDISCNTCKHKIRF